MISDERLNTIEMLTRTTINEDSTPAKVYYCFNNFSELPYLSSREGSQRSMLVSTPSKSCRLFSSDTRTDLISQANCNRLLDVARETYKENVGDIFQLNRTLTEKHNLPLTLVYQDSGFVFGLKKTELQGELPRGFINVSTQRGRWIFSSMELVGILCMWFVRFIEPLPPSSQKKMNARMKDALDETLILSDK
jgi:MutS family domain IV